MTTFCVILIKTEESLQAFKELNSWSQREDEHQQPTFGSTLYGMQLTTST